MDFDSWALGLSSPMKNQIKFFDFRKLKCPFSKFCMLKSIFFLQFMVNLVMILVRKEMDIITTGVISLKIPILELGQMQIFAG